MYWELSEESKEGTMCFQVKRGRLMFFAHLLEDVLLHNSSL